MAKTHFQRQLEAKLAERYEEVTAHMAMGTFPDWAAYRNEVGYLRGLRDVLTICEQIEAEVN